MRRRSETNQPQETASDAEPVEAASSRRGGLVGLVLLPFRAVGGILSLITSLVGVLVAIIRLPIRAAVASTRLVINTAADVVFGIWRLAAKIVGAVLGTFTLAGRLVAGVWRLLGKLGQTTTQRLAFIGNGLRFLSHGLGRVIVAVVTGTIGATLGAIGLTVRLVVGILTLGLKTVAFIVLAPLRIIGIGRTRSTPDLSDVLDVTD